MADETAGTPDAGTQDESQSSTPPTNDGTPAGTQGETAQTRTFSQADVDRLIAERLEREKGKATKAADAARAEAERKSAEEQGKWKELYEKQQSELTQAQAKARELELGKQRSDVAAKVGLPVALADRLRGETPEEMETDAKAMLAALPKPAAPNINNGAGGQAAGASAMDEAERIRLASIYGVSAKHFGLSNG